MSDTIRFNTERKSVSLDGMPTAPKAPDPKKTFLMERKFPHLKAMRIAWASNRRIVRPAIGKEPAEKPVSKPLSPEAKRRNEEIAREVSEYRAFLDKMPFSELEVLHREELEKQHLEDDQARFFHAPSAEADLDYWSKMAHWSLDEAIALSFGKAPERVGLESLANISSTESPFVHEYQRTMELARRAIVWKQLFDPVLPTIFVKWAHENDISLPDELIAKVEARSGKHVDWQQEYETILEKHKAYAETTEQLIDTLRKRIAHFESNRSEPKPLHTKERESLMKLVLGMAIGGYGFVPAESRSPTATDITNDLVSHGISLNADTVRKWLKEAAEHLPRQIPDD